MVDDHAPASRVEFLKTQAGRPRTTARGWGPALEFDIQRRHRERTISSGRSVLRHPGEKKWAAIRAAHPTRLNRSLYLLVYSLARVWSRARSEFNRCVCAGCRCLVINLSRAPHSGKLISQTRANKITNPGEHECPIINLPESDNPQRRSLAHGVLSHCPTGRNSLPRGLG